MADDTNKTPIPEETAPAVAEAVTDTQTVPAVENPTPQVPSLAPEPSTPAMADTIPAEMTPEVPEAPKATPVIESPNIPVNTGEIEVKEPEKPENITIPEPEPETASAEGNGPISTPEPTAQIPPNEPLSTTPEPVVTEPVPTPAPAVPVPPTPEIPKDEPVKEVKEEPKGTTPEVIVPTHGLALKLLIKAREAIQFRRRKKLDRLMSLFLKKSQITNDDVEKLLHISDATATRYLSILEKEGKIKQSGKTGKAVSYSRL